jgi:NitT/TauT family transport system substrate-binding protein
MNRIDQLWNRRQTLWMLTGVTGSLLLHACTFGNQKNQKTTAIGLNPWVGSTPLHIAKEKGFFQKRGLNLEVKIFSGTSDANSAYMSGRLDSWSPVTSEAVALAAKGGAASEFRIVLVQDISNGADGILARNSIKNLTEFKGKKIAVEEDSVSHFFLLKALETVKLKASDFTIVNMPPDAAAAAYQSGQIDIAVTYSPYLTKAQQAQPDGRIIFTSADLPGAIADLYVFSPQFIQDHPQIVDAFIRGIFDGLEFLNSNREEGIAIAARAIGISPEELTNDLQGIKLPNLAENLEILSAHNSSKSLLKSMQSLAEFLKERNQIQIIPELETLIEPKFLQGIKSEA